MEEQKNTSSNPEEWVERYGNYLYRYALGQLRNKDEAENLVQETFLAALNARKRFAGRSTERTWLVGILKHKIIDHIRHAYRERPVTDIQENEDTVNSFFDAVGHPKEVPSPWLPNPDELLENKEFWEILRNCLKKLPRMNQDAFLLREIEEMPSPLVCKILNITPSNLWVIMHRSRTQLRACLEANWFERTGNNRKEKKGRTTK
jgi:RNA polymerase sigma-70 factor (ECF subfamily)